MDRDSDDIDEGPAQAEFTREMGIEYVGMTDGAYVIDLDLGPKHMSRAMRAHGGVLFTLLDTALGRSVLDALPEGRGCATVEIKVNFLAGLSEGVLLSEASPLHIGRRTSVWEVRIDHDSGRHVAFASGTFMVVRRPGE